MGTFCMVCGVSTMLQSCMRPLFGHCYNHVTGTGAEFSPRGGFRAWYSSMVQFKEQTTTNAWHGVQLVRFDADGHKFANPPPPFLALRHVW